MLGRVPVTVVRLERNVSSKIEARRTLEAGDS